MTRVTAGLVLIILTQHQVMAIDSGETQRATAELRSMVGRGARVSWEIPHAIQRTIERDVSQLEAERIIRRAPVVVRADVEASGQERWRIAGEDTDGRPVHVVVKPIGHRVLRVLTVIRTDE